MKINPNITLADTIDLMCSEDYTDRFIAEYYQTKIRYEKLHDICIKLEAKTLDWAPNCPLDLIQHQVTAMGSYLHDLEVRAQIESINLEERI